MIKKNNTEKAYQLLMFRLYKRAMLILLTFHLHRFPFLNFCS
jgi:hypothetical protein